MFVGCTCGKVWQVRDDANIAALKCSACGGSLQVGHFRLGPAGPDPGAAQLRDRLGSLERDQAAQRALLEIKDRALAEAQSRVPALRQELEEAHGSLSRLADDLAREKSAHLLALDAKEKELQASREGLHKDLEVAQASLARLAEELAGEKTAHLAALQAKDRELDSERGRISALEESLEEARAQAGSREAAERAERELSELRAQMEEKVRDLAGRLDEARAAADRGAGAEETGARALREKDKVIAALEETVAGHKATIDHLERRAANLEEIRRAEHESFETRFRARGEVQARIGEARHLSSDFDRCLESIALSLTGLRDRVRRIVESLHTPEPEALPAPAAAPVEPPRAPPPESEEPVPGLEEAVGEGEPVEAPAGGELPADETLLDMGRPPAEEGNGDASDESDAIVLEAVPLIESPAEEAPRPETPPEETPAGEQTEKKPGFFSKLFGRKK
jgi:chromosome segregation ATPase